jgi:hypothetical protein
MDYRKDMRAITTLEKKQVFSLENSDCQGLRYRGQDRIKIWIDAHPLVRTWTQDCLKHRIKQWITRGNGIEIDCSIVENQEGR